MQLVEQVLRIIAGLQALEPRIVGAKDVFGLDAVVYSSTTLSRQYHTLPIEDNKQSLSPPKNVIGVEKKRERERERENSRS